MKKTHIVYTFYQDDRKKDKDTDNFFKTMKVDSVPTILILSQGKEVRRHGGITDAKKVLAGVKTSKQQEESWYPDWLRLW